MPQLAPPEPPSPVCVAVDDWPSGLRFHLWQISLSALTVLATVWFMTLGAIPGILALLTAKHILVAILVMGLGVNAPDQDKE